MEIYSCSTEKEKFVWKYANRSPMHYDLIFTPIEPTAKA